MISRVLGSIARIGVGDVVVVHGGIGFQVFVTPPFASELHKGDDVELYTHLIVREDSLTLYGFKTEEEREVFEILMSVSGIGPRIGLAALSVFTRMIYGVLWQIKIPQLWPGFPELARRLPRACLWSWEISSDCRLNFLRPRHRCRE